MDLELSEKKIFSQNGEDGVTIKLIELLYGEEDARKNKYYVEFGVEDGRECNTRILREKYNWQGLQMDGSNENATIHLKKEFITRENIVELFEKYKVPEKINILSVDIDYNDFYCLKEILAKYTCDIIICEYNSTHSATDNKIVIYDSEGMWDGSNYFGVSLYALEKLGNLYNYSLIYCDKKGVNCYLMHNSLLLQKKLQFKNFGDIHKIYRPAKYGHGPNGGHRHDPYNRPYITFAESLTDNYISVGRSNTNSKIIKLNREYPANTVFILNENPCPDTFSGIIDGALLTVTRTDVSESIGWGYLHSGYISTPEES
jgi:hypothetical protein